MPTPCSPACVVGRTTDRGASPIIDIELTGGLTVSSPRSSSINPCAYISCSAVTWSLANWEGELDWVVVRIEPLMVVRRSGVFSGRD